MNEIFKTYYESSKYMKNGRKNGKYVKYEVSNKGNVKRNGEPYILKQNNCGYLYCGLNVFVH